MRERLDPNGVLHVSLEGDSFRDLTVLLDRVRHDESAQAVLFRSGKSGNFLTGIELESMARMDDAYQAAERARFGQSVFQKIADLQVPTVCIISASCTGGDFELALACDYRLACDDSGTSIGLPEIRLGAIPGFGGTQRLPRLTGFTKALELITSGIKLCPREALQAGLVDEVVPQDYLEETACDFLARVLEESGSIPVGVRRKRSTRDLLMDRAVATFGAFRRQVLAEADRKIRRESIPEQYPAPFRALEALEAAVTLPLSQGLDREAKIVGELVSGATAKNLMWLFQNQSSLRHSSQEGPALHSSGESRREAPERRRVGIIGAGLMGGGISRVVAEAGMRVRLMDRSWDPILAALRTNRKAWDRQVRNNRLTILETESRIARVAPTTDHSGFARCEFLIEAVEERLELKQKVLAAMDPLMADDAVYTTSTSSLSIGEIARGTSRPDRVVGLHFFNPVERMPLVEIIAGAASSREAVLTVRDFAIRLGKVPVVVRDSPGFLVNRILMIYLGEAIRLLSEGVRVDVVDQAMVRFGMPLGPFALMDGIGLDTVLQVARVLQSSFGKRVEGSTRTLESLIVSERYGQRKGGGFYRYRRGRKTLPDPEVYNLAEVGPVLSLPPETLQERMVLAMVNEAASCLADQVVGKPSELDVAMVTGTGYPPFRGGLLRYADSTGIAVVVDRLNRLADAHGERFRPVATLNDMVTAQRRFYGQAE